MRYKSVILQTIKPLAGGGRRVCRSVSSQVYSYWGFCKPGRDLSIVGTFPALTISRSYPEGWTAPTTLSLGQTSLTEGCLSRIMVVLHYPWTRISVLCRSVQLVRYTGVVFSQFRASAFRGWSSAFWSRVLNCFSEERYRDGWSNDRGR